MQLSGGRGSDSREQGPEDANKECLDSDCFCFSVVFKAWPQGALIRCMHMHILSHIFSPGGEMNSCIIDQCAVLTKQTLRVGLTHCPISHFLPQSLIPPCINTSKRLVLPLFYHIAHLPLWQDLFCNNLWLSLSPCWWVSLACNWHLSVACRPMPNSQVVANIIIKSIWL